MQLSVAHQVDFGVKEGFYENALWESGLGLWWRRLWAIGSAPIFASFVPTAARGGRNRLSHGKPVNLSLRESPDLNPRPSSVECAKVRYVVQSPLAHQVNLGPLSGFYKGTVGEIWRKFMAGRFWGIGSAVIFASFVPHAARGGRNRLSHGESVNLVLRERPHL
jgi:hypothetical protein